MGKKEFSDREINTPVFTEADFTQMMGAMHDMGVVLEASDRDEEIVFSGAGDTGTIQTSADLDVSQVLLAIARQKFKGSFSEEDDPQNMQGYLRQLPEHIEQGIWIIDPVDGTGDRKYGQLGTPEQKGYSILAAFVQKDKVEASVVVRPAYGQILTYDHEQIKIASRGKEVLMTRDTRPKSAQGDPIRVNVRNAYPEIAFPSDFWDFAKQNTGITFKEVRSGGAGDSLSRLILGQADLVVARKGDWKAWDTAPFDPMIRTLGGRMTNCDNQPLGGYHQDDLWHHRGVIASVDRSDAHTAFVHAIDLYKNQKGRDLVIQTPKR